MSEVKRGLTLKSIVLLIILVPTSSMLSVLVALYTDRPYTFGTFPMPMLFIAILAEILGRINPRLRLSPQEYLFIFIVLSFMGAYTYLAFHAAPQNEIVFYVLFGPLADYQALGVKALGRAWSRALPSMLFPPEPLRFEIARMLVEGRAPGEPVPWLAITPSFAYWLVIFAFYAFIGMFVTFTFGKVWVEEGLAFPLAVPSIYLFREAGEVSPGKNKAKLFDWSLTTTKIFWASFAVSTLLGVYQVIAELLPAFPMAAWWGETKIPFPLLAKLWPGIYASFVFNGPLAAVCLVMPNDVLLTFVLGWLVLGVLYQGIAIRLGIIPYKPGMEYVWPWEDYPGRWLPFPYRWVGANGVAVGMGLWIIAMNWSRVKSVLSTLWKRGFEEDGLPMRWVSTLLAVGALGWYVLMLAEGADPLIALFIPALAFLFHVVYARVYAEVVSAVSVGWGDPWEPLYLIGVYTRGWPPPGRVTMETPMLDPAWFTIARHMSRLGVFNIAEGAISAGHQVTLYKMARDLKMSLRDFFIAMIAGLAALLLLLMPLAAYFIFHTRGGLSATNGVIYSWVPWKTAEQLVFYRGYPAEVTTEYNLLVLFGAGILIAVGLYALKTYVPFFWFINVPALYAVMQACNYFWLMAMIALAIKYVLLRTLGMRKYVEYITPVIAGCAFSFGLAWALLAVYDVVDVVIPKAASLFQP